MRSNHWYSIPNLNLIVKTLCVWLDQNFGLNLIAFVVLTVKCFNIFTSKNVYHVYFYRKRIHKREWKTDRTV